MEVSVPNVPGRINDGPEYFILKSLDYSNVAWFCADVKNSWSHISNLVLFLHGVHADITTRKYYLQAEATLTYNPFPICPETIRTMNF